MTEELSIEKIQISQPKSVAGPTLDGSERQAYVVGIHVRNHSTKETYHVISDVRSLEYDPATQTLRLGLIESEPTPEEERLYIRKSVPHQMMIPPNQEAVIEVSVPRVIKRVNLGASTGLGLGLEMIDVSGMQHVNCRIAFSAAPFYVRPTEPSDKMRERLRAWGMTIERTVAPHREEPPPRVGSQNTTKRQ